MTDTERLRGAVRLAIVAFEQLIDPDPQKGILTNVKQQGEKQGIPLDSTYDAVVDLIALLKAELGESDEGIDHLSGRRQVERLITELQFTGIRRELARKIRDRDRSEPRVVALSEYFELVDALVALILDGKQPQEESQ